MFSVSDVEYFLGLDRDPTQKELDRLDQLLGYLNEQARQGDPKVGDDVYDILRSILEQLDPNASSLASLWDEYQDAPPLDNLDYWLAHHPMSSIQSIKDESHPDLIEFFENLKAIGVMMSCKIDGHGVRLVYQDGYLVRATSRARNTSGRDLTRQLSLIAPQNIPVTGLVEIRGEVCLAKDKLEAARSFTPTLKTPFSAVASLLRDSASDEETSLLDFLAYRLLDGTDRTKPEEYEALAQIGFSTPYFEDYTLPEDTSYPVSEWVDTVDVFSNNVLSSYPYYLDGVVLEDCRGAVGIDESAGYYRTGALAWKAGGFAQEVYTGIVREIAWYPGRTKFSPVAVLDEPIVTSHGNSVTNIPLYEPINIEVLSAYPGQPLSFKYGGEAGVVPCFMDGTLLSNQVRNIVTEEISYV